MLAISAFLAVAGIFLAIFIWPHGFSWFYPALWIALFGSVFTPVFYFLRKNIERAPAVIIVLLQLVFLIAAFSGGIAGSLYEQPMDASFNCYCLAVFTVSVFIVMPSAVSAVLLPLTCCAYLLLLPGFQPDPEVIAGLNVSAISMTAIAWILNQVVYRKEIVFFINQKIITEKNMELEMINVELIELTMRDSMTNLLNHKNSIRRLREEVDRAKRIHYPLSVAMVDLDNFKLVNDTYGHQTGDEVLIQVARVLSENCRATDIVGRYGGEEFIIIMPDTNGRDAVALLERIQAVIEETNCKDGIHVTLSCGVSELNGDSVHGVLKSSDLMLYEAKKKGKNRVEVQICENRKSAAIN